MQRRRWPRLSGRMSRKATRTGVERTMNEAGDTSSGLMSEDVDGGGFKGSNGSKVDEIMQKGHDDVGGAEGSNMADDLLEM